MKIHFDLFHLIVFIKFKLFYDFITLSLSYIYVMAASWLLLLLRSFRYSARWWRLRIPADKLCKAMRFLLVVRIFMDRFLQKRSFTQKTIAAVIKIAWSSQFVGALYIEQWGWWSKSTFDCSAIARWYSYSSDQLAEF